eukprot:SAG31_NODE_29561_length_393_cov_0.850340_1_plen_67_part_01
MLLGPLKLEEKVQQVEEQATEIERANQQLQLTRVDVSRERISQAVELSMVARAQHQQLAERLEVKSL